jgi:hypothetical protein
VIVVVVVVVVVVFGFSEVGVGLLSDSSVVKVIISVVYEFGTH